MSQPGQRHVPGVAELRRELQRTGAGWPANSLLASAVDSTNLLARRLVTRLVEDDESVPEFVVVGVQQTGGRGRDGRSWWSPPGAGVYATWVTTLAAELVPWLPLRVPLALCRALDRFVPRRCGVKWPNDLLIDGKKVGGVLIEAVRRAGTDVEVLIGFGINTGHPAAEKPELNATSLEQEMGSAPSLAAVIDEAVGGVGRELARALEPLDLVAAYRSILVHAAGDRMRVRTGETTLQGAFAGVDDAGFLLLELEGGREIRRIAAGEVMR